MANDNHASYSKIGFTVVAALAAIAFALVYFAGIDDEKNIFLVETYSDRPVSGLSVGSAVNFRGVKIGEVRDIAFFGSLYDVEKSTVEAQRISILMALDLRKLGNGYTREQAELYCREYVNHGLRATVTASGITGLARIELGIPEIPQPLPDLRMATRHPLIPPQVSLLDSFSVSATKVMNALNQVDFRSVWSNVSVVASSSAHLVENADRLLAEQLSGLVSIVRNVEAASASVSELVDELKHNPSLLLRSADPEELPETER